MSPLRRRIGSRRSDVPRALTGPQILLRSARRPSPRAPASELVAPGQSRPRVDDSVAVMATPSLYEIAHPQAHAPPPRPPLTAPRRVAPSRADTQSIVCATSNDVGFGLDVAACGAALAEALQAPGLQFDGTAKAANGLLASPSLAQRSRLSQRRWLHSATSSHLAAASFMAATAALRPSRVCGSDRCFSSRAAVGVYWNRASAGSSSRGTPGLRVDR